MFFGGDFVRIELVGDTFDASAEAAQNMAEDHQMRFIDPFDDPAIIAGQGTLAVELLARSKAAPIILSIMLWQQLGVLAG